MSSNPVEGEDEFMQLLESYVHSYSNLIKIIVPAMAKNNLIKPSDQQAVDVSLPDMKSPEERHHFSLKKLGVLCDNPERFVYAMQKLGIVTNEHHCIHCQSNCKLEARHRSDRRATQFKWTCDCRGKRKRYQRSVFFGSIFYRCSRPEKLLQYVFQDLAGCPSTSIAQMVGVSNKTATELR
jgi:hypothetical protein